MGRTYIIHVEDENVVQNICWKTSREEITSET